MIKVTEAIKKIIRQKDAKIVSASEAQLALLKNLQQQVRREIGMAAIGSWNQYHLKQVLDQIERTIADISSAATGEAGKSLDHAWDLGQQSVYAPIEQSGLAIGGFHLSTSVLDALKEFTFHKIQGVYGDAWSRIRGELQLGVLGQKTPFEVAEGIGRDLASPGIFKTVAERAEFIQQTEMGRAFSEAANRRMLQAKNYVPGLKKQWWHAGHPKQPRINHLGIDGQTRDIDKPFNLADRNGNPITMMYPRDPKAPFGEVAGCGCDHVVWHSAWGERRAA